MIGADGRCLCTEAIASARLSAVRLPVPSKRGFAPQGIFSELSKFEAMNARMEKRDREEVSMLKEAAAVTKMARASVKESAVEVRVAEVKLRRERRLDEERERRWWAAERREEAPPAYLQLERAYKSKVRDLEARLEVSEAQRCEAEARAELQGCLLLQEQLAHARLRDRLCGDVV